MLNKYDVFETTANLLGHLGQIIVWLGMLAGCILLWFFVFAFMFNG